METAQYLLMNYYPDTSIDTEIAVRAIANKVSREQDFVLFQLRRRMDERFSTD